jgi:superfamily II DNA or RNA helicase
MTGGAGMKAVQERAAAAGERSSHAVGSLVSIRGREWVVLPDSDADVLMVRPLGGTEDETIGILTALEHIEPATFALPDPAKLGDYRSTRLLRDALRLGFRSSAGPFRSFGRIAVTPRPYQLVPLLMALKLDPVRMLIADDVGVGKTVEALVIAREQLDHGDIRRLAVLCSPQLAEQWQREMRDKFHLDAELVLPSTVTRLERRLGVGESLFDRYPLTVVSTDYIKSERRRHEFLRAAPELVIVDEAHTCVDAGTGSGGQHQRHRLLRGLAEDRTRHLLLLTATPHSGKEEAFRSLLALLAPRFAGLPEDLAGPAHEQQRRELARHFVQRRRADIRSYLDEETTFPTRETAEATYTLSDGYRRLFDRVLDFARETVVDLQGGARRQRVRWWSALALLRSLASSPAAAAATLRNRADALDTDTAADADEVGRRAVLDHAGDETAEAVDVSPGGDYAEQEADSDRVRRRLRDLAREADALSGADGDCKLAAATKLVKALLKDGHNPILFCRFIPTAEYLAAALRDTLPRAVTVEAVTGILPPEEREARITTLADTPAPRVLVATDCLSEGINLQHGFDAVVHYDLSWNPTRHEQREGRVDRFGQPRPVVRAVTFYGRDNRIDGIVLDVLLRKHEAIRRTLGVSVPVPAGSNAVVEAIMEGLLLRGADAQQLELDLGVAEERDALHTQWEDAAERERRSRTVYAQQTIKPEEVWPEVQAMRAAVGSETAVEGFVTGAVLALGGLATQRNGVTHLDLAEAPRAVREAMGLRETAAVAGRFSLPVEEDEEHLARTHPLVEGLASYVLDTALDPMSEAVAARAGAFRTRAVATRTTLLLVRFRFHLLVHDGGDERQLLAEDARVLGFTGSPAQAVWLDDAEVAALVDARPDANIGPEQAATFVRTVTDGWAALAPQIDAEARALGDRLLDAHRRVRDAARRKGVRFEVRPHLPADPLGVYVLLPAEVA